MVDPTHLPYDPSYSNHRPAAALWAAMTRNVSTIHNFAVDFGARERGAISGGLGSLGDHVFLKATVGGQGTSRLFFRLSIYWLYGGYLY